MQPFIDHPEFTAISESLKHKESHIITQSDQGVLILNEDSKLYQMVAWDEAHACELIDKIADGFSLCLYGPFGVEYARQKYKREATLRCTTMVYQSRKRLSSNHRIQPLALEDIDFVLKHYSNSSVSKEYLEDRIRKQFMFGASIDTRCAGFIGLHEEGSLGMLEVIAEFRRKGVGNSLVAFMVNHCLDRERIPYAQIVTGNQSSIIFHEKMGFTHYRREAVWFVEE